ncbi:hypothetical protein B0E41_08645 [Hydrogenophaga sp. A37]|nr:hypothetical protein B0E41_08645 [Hydrogenophaga sp. A37]
MNPSSFEQFNASYLLARIQCVGAEQDWDKLVQSSDLYDCIVTDPPYGFNTEEDSSTLAKLYYRFLRKWIARIKPDGHLVLCLPQEAYNGQPLPSCTNPQIVISQILAIAIELNRTAFLPVRSLASNSPGSTAPYYWESAKVLRRTILHFQFIDMRTG